MRREILLGEARPRILERRMMVVWVQGESLESLSGSIKRGPSHANASNKKEILGSCRLLLEWPWGKEGSGS